ncbi:hypothetical protein [Psychroflexus tropicus]|uniref:hypothetical protein n=1 Tax=Psychroflexus tropicus TaxID=197345 RepID=UPI000370EB97|nr:hypothetical protein [Psychroflexus tropicus]
MTQDKIHGIYKRLAYIIGGISLIVLIVPFGDYDLPDRLGLALTLNIGFHLFYYAISLVPLTQLGWLKEYSTTKELAKRGYTAMSYFIIVACLFVSITTITEVASTQEFYRLTTLLVLTGVILGALKLNLELRGKK